ncbi:hypothetical protein LTR84_001381 [Exophiala bonariae]|uniref:AB hydrolase-1 domain-containing protein n=1 Tax=Exophiala bonariae TaxID=1690606 RepID=A0AAV9NCC6_9EURO|nr:hypothetical protein LTR84_001381 [Exophiala bonariae]
MATKQSNMVDFERNKITYDSYGSGTEALVFIHALWCNRTLWHRQEPLFNGNRCIVIDLPGHGDSDAPQKDYTQYFFAGAVHAVLQKEEINRAVLVGHMVGGVVSTMFLRCFSRFISVVGIIYVESFLHLPQSYIPAEGVRRQVENLSSPGILNQAINEVWSTSKNPDVQRLLKCSMKRADRLSCLNTLANPYTHTMDWAEIHQVPAVHFTTPRLEWFDKQAWLHHVPQLKVKMWGEEHGNFLFLEDPDRFNQDVVNFLAENDLFQH